MVVQILLSAQCFVDTCKSRHGIEGFQSLSFEAVFCVLEELNNFGQRFFSLISRCSCCLHWQLSATHLRLKSVADYIYEFVFYLIQKITESTFLDAEISVTVRGSPVTGGGCWARKEPSVEIRIINAH